MPKNPLKMMHVRRIIGAVACAAAIVAVETSLQAQETPVYVDDSPIAGELFREAQDQASVNVGEAVRLYQDILDDFALRLIHADSASVHRFQAARLRVLNELINDPAPGGLLERHRIMEHAEAQRLYQAGDFERLVLTRPWTEPGLVALLRVSQRNIESARFDAANNALDLVLRHPDLHANPRSAAYAWLMRGIASHYAGESATVEQAMDQLQQLTDAGHRFAEALADQLRLLTRDAGPEIARGTSPLNVGSVSASVALEELVAEEIWSVPLPETLYSRRFSQNAGRGQMRRGRDQARTDGLLMTAAPTVVGASNGMVYINQGHHIMALDRFTGSPMWPLVGGYVERPPLTIIDRDDDHARDLNVIAVEYDALVTLTGHAHASNRSNEGRVVCLDANTGEFRWSTRIDRISAPGVDEDEHEGLFPHSAPVIAEGKVFVLARKVSPQSLTSTYLVALHLEDGSLAWIRHIASSGSIRRAARSFSTPVYLDGDLYLNTGVGAVARIAADSGETRWLHRFAVPLNPSSLEQMRRPWELDAPVVTSQYVISLLPGIPGGPTTAGGPRVLVLDRLTGHEVALFDAAQAGWGTPAYLLSAGVDSPWIFAVGREILAVHHDALHAPVWSLPQPLDESPIEVLGRVHIVAKDTDGADDHQAPALVVPSNAGLLIVDGAAGVVINRLELEASANSTGEPQHDGQSLAGMAGNPVVVDSQLFIADNEHLRSYMALSHAVGMLQERIAADPADPEPGMALLRLAIAAAEPGDDSMAANKLSDGFELVMSSAAAVMQSIKQSPPEAAAEYQSRLFSLLLTLNVAETAADMEQGEAAFALMREVIAAGDSIRQEGTNRAQVVDYLLAYGDWLVAHDGQSAQAEHAYRSVLQQPALAAVRRREGEVVRPGGSWARRRLAEIGADDEALGALTFSTTGTVSLPSIGSQRGPAVLLEGALARRGDGILSGGGGDWAEKTVPWAMLLHGSDLRLHETLGSARQAALPQRWFMSAAGVLDHTATTARVWQVDDERLIVWIGSNATGGGSEGMTGGRFMMVKAATGQALWVAQPADAIFGAVQRRLRAGSGSVSGRDSRFETGAVRGGAFVIGGSAQREPLDVAELLPLVGKDAAYLVRRDGAVARFAFDDGATATWVRQDLLDEVHHARVGMDIIVLAGRARNAPRLGSSSRRGEATTPALVSLDARTGEPTHAEVPIILGASDAMPGIDSLQENLSGRSDSDVQWISLDASGLLMSGTASGVQAWDMTSNSFLWMNTSQRLRGTTRGWMAGRYALVETRDGDLCSIDLVEARLTGVLAGGDAARGQGTGAWGSVRDVTVHGRSAASEADRAVVVHYPQRIVWLDVMGNTLGTDFIQDDRNYRWVLPASDRIIAISAHQPRQQPVTGRADGSGGGRRTHHVYSVYTLSDNGRLLDDPLQLPALYEPIRDAQLMDGWLLMSTSDHTIAVPFPVEG